MTWCVVNSRFHTHSLCRNSERYVIWRHNGLVLSSNEFIPIRFAIQCRFFIQRFWLITIRSIVCTEATSTWWCKSENQLQASGGGSWSQMRKFPRLMLASDHPPCTTKCGSLFIAPTNQPQSLFSIHIRTNRNTIFQVSKALRGCMKDVDCTHIETL